MSSEDVEQTKNEDKTENEEVINTNNEVALKLVFDDKMTLEDHLKLIRPSSPFITWSSVISEIGSRRFPYSGAELSKLRKQFDPKEVKEKKPSSKIFYCKRLDKLMKRRRAQTDAVDGDDNDADEITQKKQRFSRLRDSARLILSLFKVMKTETFVDLYKASSDGRNCDDIERKANTTIFYEKVRDVFNHDACPTAFAYVSTCGDEIDETDRENHEFIKDFIATSSPEKKGLNITASVVCSHFQDYEQRYFKFSSRICKSGEHEKDYKKYDRHWENDTLCYYYMREAVKKHHGTTHTMNHGIIPPRPRPQSSRKRKKQKVLQDDNAEFKRFENLLGALNKYADALQKVTPQAAPQADEGPDLIGRLLKLRAELKNMEEDDDDRVVLEAERKRIRLKLAEHDGDPSDKRL